MRIAHRHHGQRQRSRLAGKWHHPLAPCVTGCACARGAPGAGAGRSHRKGMSGSANTGAPMSTRDLAVCAASAAQSALAWSARGWGPWSVSPRSRTKRAKQRAPLPHCSTSVAVGVVDDVLEVDPLRRAQAARTGSGRHRTPKWRSPRKRYWAALRPKRPRVSSSTHKVVAGTLHFGELDSHGAIIGPLCSPTYGTRTYMGTKSVG